MSNEEIVEQIQDGTQVAVNQERLWKRNRPFVRQQVHKICGITETDSDFEDYEQEGFIGLLTAAVKYDRSRETKFLTCAGWYIKRAIIRYSENCSSSVRVPVYLRARIRKYAGYRQQVRNEKGRYPTREELLRELDISERSLDHLERTIFNMRVVSMDQDHTEDNGESALLNMLQSNEDIEKLITYSIYRKDLKKALDSAISILDLETRSAIQSIYYQRNSIRQTAELFGCSRQAIYEKTRKGFWKILHSSHLEELESFMPEGYRYNKYVYSGFAELEEEDESNKFLI